METANRTGVFAKTLAMEHGIDRAWQRLKKYFGLPVASSATRKLGRTLSTAKFRRAIERIRSPRRIALTLLAILLSIIWLGQAIAGVMLRKTATEEKLLKWIPISLGIYFIWNFLKIAGQKPVEPFEWTETEKELLFGAPLERSDVIRYRCSTIARAALTKSLIFTFVMIPDLRFLPLGFLAIFIGLVFIELIRVITEIIVYGLTKTELWMFRAAVFGTAAIVVGRAIAETFLCSSFQGAASSAASFELLFALGEALVSQGSTWYGEILLFPFNWISQLIVAPKFGPTQAFQLLLSGIVTFGLTTMIPKWDDFFCIRRIGFERDRFGQLILDGRNANAVQRFEPTKLTRPVTAFGAGSLAWRQLKGAWNFRYSLAISLLIPSVLSCMPAFSGVNDYALVANTVGALAFYSMVLLPASLKFDFRRDVERLVILKSLPITPFFLTVGQLATPILLTTAFQLFSLLLVMMVTPYNPIFIPVALLVLFPFNLFVFSFENLAFLWYPYRLNQEGMQVLLRSILVFTAKSLLFALAFGTTFVWVIVAKWICEHWFSNSVVLTTPSIFAVGMILMLSSVSVFTFNQVVRAIGKFDPSTDLVGLD